MEESESADFILQSFRESFTSLHGKMAMAFTYHDQVRTSGTTDLTMNLPAIFEDDKFEISGNNRPHTSANSRSGGFPPKPLVSQSVSSNSFNQHNSKRPMTAGASLGTTQDSASEAELLDSVLEKYSDLFVAKIEKKLLESTFKRESMEE